MTDKPTYQERLKGILHSDKPTHQDRLKGILDSKGSAASPAKKEAGSNLDKPLNEGAINLTTGGLQRHRVVWIREMSEEDIRQVGESGPTIDRIEVAKFESQTALKEWLSQHAPAFLR